MFGSNLKENCQFVKVIRTIITITSPVKWSQWKNKISTVLQGSIAGPELNALYWVSNTFFKLVYREVSNKRLYMYICLQIKCCSYELVL